MNNREVTVTTAALEELAKSTMSVQDAAQALGRPRITIYRWRDAGKIKSIKFGGIYYIPVSEVERLKKEQKEEK